MKFSYWIKIKEQNAPTSAPTSAPTAPAASVGPSNVSLSGGTKSSDIAKVPQKIFTRVKQTSSKECRNCSKDWKNWHYTKKRKKIK